MDRYRRVIALAGAILLTFSLQPIARATGRPDLKVASLKLSNAPGTKGFNATDRTKNAGAGAAGATKTRFYVSKDKERGNDFRVKSRTVSSLGGGVADSATTFINPHARDVPDGKYFVIACADGKGAVAESNEGNNCLTSKDTIDVVTEPGEEPLDPGIPPASFTGSIEANQTRTGQVDYTEHQSTTLEYEVVSYSSNPGDATYRLTSATIQYSIEGTDENGCQFSTSGSLTPPMDSTTELTLEKQGADDFYYEAVFGDRQKVPLNQCGRTEWELDPFWDTGRQPDGSFVAHFMTADRHLRANTDKNLAGTTISRWTWDLAGEGEAEPTG